MYANLSRGLEYLPVKRLAEAIRAEDPEGFLRGVQAVTANIKYEMHIQDEKYYQTIFFVSFFLLGGYIEAESHSNVGSLDAYVRTAKTVYIFEFKLNRTAEKAVGQIIDRRYYEKFRLCGLPVRLFGVNFDYSQRNITAWKELPLPE
jgi:hypothetical protein